MIRKSNKILNQDRINLSILTAIYYIVQTMKDNKINLSSELYELYIEMEKILTERGLV